MVKKLRLSVVWLVLSLVVITLSLIIQNQWNNGIDQAKRHYIDSGRAATASQISKLETAVRSIYENIRTLSLLPNVRDIDRHAKNLSAEARVTFQQIYNNLAASVDVSEVYIVPIDFNPNKFDVFTLKTEEPIMMFDELIVNAGKGPKAPNSIGDAKSAAAPIAPDHEEVESFEFSQLVDHAKWLKEHYPNISDIKKLEVPFISGPEVITCDNRIFATTGVDGDRSGIMFSVPFYGNDGKISGLISAIVLTSSLRDLLPLQNMALVNPGNNYANLANGAVKMAASRKLIEAGKQDPNLIYSEVISLSVLDQRSPWAVWSGLPNEQFWFSKDVAYINSTRRTAFIGLAVFALAAGIMVFLIDRFLRQAATLGNTSLQMRLMAERSEAEAIESATSLKTLNEDVSRLNKELSAKIKELTDAQDTIIAKGKMAQLGNLVATVAHELRNPLGGVRTTAYMLRRRLEDADIDVTTQLERIDSGIARCDGIISQLLDFSRSQPLSTCEVNLENWLLKVVSETAESLPENVSIQMSLGTQGMMAQIDSERLRQGLVNLLNNAADAITKNADISSLPLNPAIIVGLKNSARGVEISIADNGPGISPDIIEKISEALFTTKSFGAGLGIAAVRKIAMMHGGGLNIVSELGHGSHFTIWFPLVNNLVKVA